VSKRDLIAHMKFSKEYEPQHFTKEELKMLAAISVNWDINNMDQALEVIWKHRGLI
jgi:hypothetical protein